MDSFEKRGGTVKEDSSLLATVDDFLFFLKRSRNKNRRLYFSKKVELSNLRINFSAR